jgi:hypothetical protein
MLGASDEWRFARADSIGEARMSAHMTSQRLAIRYQVSGIRYQPAVLPPVPVVLAGEPAAPPLEAVPPAVDVPPIAFELPPTPLEPAEAPPVSLPLPSTDVPADPAVGSGGTVQVPLTHLAFDAQSVWRIQLSALAQPPPSTQSANRQDRLQRYL